MYEVQFQDQLGQWVTLPGAYDTRALAEAAALELPYCTRVVWGSRMLALLRRQLGYEPTDPVKFAGSVRPRRRLDDPGLKDYPGEAGPDRAPPPADPDAPTLVTFRR